MTLLSKEELEKMRDATELGYEGYLMCSPLFGHIDSLQAKLDEIAELKKQLEQDIARLVNALEQIRDRDPGRAESEIAREVLEESKR